MNDLLKSLYEFTMKKILLKFSNEIYMLLTFFDMRKNKSVLPKKKLKIQLSMWAECCHVYNDTVYQYIYIYIALTLKSFVN